MKRILRARLILIVIAIGVVGFYAPGIGGQNSPAPVTSPTATPAPSAAGSAAPVSGLQQVFGDSKTFLLETAPDGTIEMETKEGVLQHMTCRKEVVLKTDNLDINSDILEYFGAEKKLIATGKPVNLRMRDVKATCGHFEYFVDAGKSVLTENPLINQTDAQGRVLTTTGGVITINTEKATGNTTVLIVPKAKEGVSDEAPPRIQLEGAHETPAPAETPAATGPVKIDNTNLDQIQEAPAKHEGAVAP
ncbi:MAG: hypothetical protein V2A74_02945 [bacterium]